MLLGFKPGIVPFKVIIPLGHSAIPPLLQRCQYLNNGEFCARHFGIVICAHKSNKGNIKELEIESTHDFGL